MNRLTFRVSTADKPRVYVDVRRDFTDMDLTRRFERLVATMCAGVLATGGFFTRARAQGNNIRDQRRIIHHFDFDERNEGNLEDIPKFWTSLRLPGFPRFTEGRFDFKVGHAAAPSFHLSCKGRNVSFHYGGPETMVRARSVYEITGFILPDRLENARTCLTAHFVDRAGNPIPGTLMRSRFVGASEGNGDWVAVTLHLPAVGPEAESIGVGAWVLQERLWATQTPSSWHIPRRDVHAGAWFDDITIRAIPRAEITTSQSGQVMAPEASQALLVTLSDFNDRTLTGRVVITAADGALVEETAVPVVVDRNVEPTRIPVDHLAPGFYRATAHVLEGGKPIVSRTLSFVRVGQRFQPPGVAARAFGVVIDPSSRAAPRTETDLLRGLALRSAKVPIWSGLAEPPLTPAEQRARDRELTELAADGFVLTGAFLGPPSSVIRRTGRDAPELIDLLTDAPEVWETHLASAVAPYATLLRWWQIGAEGSRSALRSADFASALARMRKTMSRFVSTPLFTLPSSAADETPRERLAAEQVSIKLSPQTRPATLARQFEQYGKLGYERVSAYVEPLSAQRYRRLPRLIDFTRRIILARHSGADTVFVPQPWLIVQDTWQRQAEPVEEYLIVRTIADVLSDAKPGQRINVAPGVQCLAFHRGRTTTLVIWDQSAPAGGNEYALQLGSASRWVDMWGRSQPLPRGPDGRHKLLLTQAPIFVPGVQRWLLDLRTSIAFDPAHVESGTELMRHNLRVAHRGDRSISGTIELDLPENWEINPWSFRISLSPQRSATFPLEARYPHIEPAGVRTVRAKIQLDFPPYYMEVPIDIDVGLKDLKVSGMAIIERGDLVLRHIITNQSSVPLNFRSSAEIPGRERQYRPIYSLGSGETQTVEYRFTSGGALTGETFRLGLRETRDGGRSHTIQQRIP